MRKAATIAGVMLLVATFVCPVFARGPMGGGPGAKGMGQAWGPGTCGQRWAGSAALSEEQRAQLQGLRQRFLDETVDLRSELCAKRRELEALLTTTTPDEARVRELQSQINELRNELSQKRLNYRLQAKKVAPDLPFCYGMRPYGCMGPYGGGRGFGPGACLP